MSGMPNRKFHATTINRVGNIVRHINLLCKVLRPSAMPYLVDWKGNEFKAENKYYWKGISLNNTILNLVGFKDGEYPVPVCCSGIKCYKSGDDLNITEIERSEVINELCMNGKFVKGILGSLDFIAEDGQIFSFSPGLEKIHQLQNVFYLLSGKEINIDTVFNYLKPREYLRRR